MTCPLCKHDQRTQIAGCDRRKYWHCPACDLIAVDPADYVSAAEAKERYAQHNNTADNPGYCEFLSQIFEPMREYLRADMRVLDYGCGPGPVLAEMIEAIGPQCDRYDPHFFPDDPQPPYEAIFSTECFEHFETPRVDIGQLVSWLRPGGYLAIMTLLWTDETNFSEWHYPRDPTHVCFYHARTLDWIAQQYDLRMLWSDGARCHILQKMK